MTMVDDINQENL